MATGTMVRNKVFAVVLFLGVVLSLFRNFKSFPSIFTTTTACGSPTTTGPTLAPTESATGSPTIGPSENQTKSNVSSSQELELLPKPSAAAGKQDSYSSFVWETIPKDKRGRGFIFSAYSFDKEKSLPKFLGEATEAAKRLKHNNPSISVAIITNEEPSLVSSVFDHIVPVPESMLFSSQSVRPDGIFRQWFSRTFFLAHSPFEITWYLDSHGAVVSEKLQDAFDQFERSGLDFAVSNPWVNGKAYCHNFAMVFRWNDRVKNLFIDWIFHQLQFGISGDDQKPLCEALGCSSKNNGLKFGSIPPNWAFAWLSLNHGKDGEWWKHRTTRVIKGPAGICHSNRAKMCEIAKNDTSKPRVYYHDRSKNDSWARAIFSQKEMNKILPYNQKWVDWSDPQTEFRAETFPCKYTTTFSIKK